MHGKPPGRKDRHWSSLEPLSRSATNDATHDRPAFQLIAISLVEYDWMSSMKQNCGAQPASLPWANGSWMPEFGPPEIAPAGGCGSVGSSSWAYRRVCWFCDVTVP